MVIVTLLTQVRKEKDGKINFLPGIEPSTQRLGVQYIKHQAITQDKSLSPYSSLCTTSGHWRILVYWTPSLWVPGSMPRRQFVFPFQFYNT